MSVGLQVLARNERPERPVRKRGEVRRVLRDPSQQRGPVLVARCRRQQQDPVRFRAHDEQGGVSERDQRGEDGSRIGSRPRQDRRDRNSQGCLVGSSTHGRGSRRGRVLSTVSRETPRPPTPRRRVLLDLSDGCWGNFIDAGPPCQGFSQLGSIEFGDALAPRPCAYHRRTHQHAHQRGLGRIV
jgi:hypothetical protein